MPSLILWIFLLLGSCQLFAQAPTATQEAQMRALGFEPVNLSELRAQQAAQPRCSTCPGVARRAPVAAPTPTPTEELAALRANLPRLQRFLADSQADPNADPAMRQKHQVALDRATARIRVLEQQLAPTSR